MGLFLSIDSLQGPASKSGEFTERSGDFTRKNVRVESPVNKVSVTVLNVHEVYASAGYPKQCLRVLAAMPTVG